MASERVLPPEVLFVVAAVSLYSGSSLAVLVFDEVGVLGVAWLRILGAALVLLAWRRPWRRPWTRRDLLLVAAFGVVTSSMNTAFYLAIERLPVGTAVAIEFLGPVSVAAARGRGRRDLVALVFAASGVALVSGVRWEGDAPGVLWALTAAALWAGYIVGGSRVADSGAGIDGLAVGLAVGVVALAPVGAPDSVEAWSSAGLLALCLGVGILSNAVPYGLDQVVLRRLTAARFALLLAILPVTATLVAAVVLGQVPRPVEAVGIGLVVVGLAVRDRREPLSGGRGAPSGRSARARKT